MRVKQILRYAKDDRKKSKGTKQILRWAKDDRKKSKDKCKGEGSFVVPHPSRKIAVWMGHSAML